MFFRMLIKDLKEKIGLNITLFLFMVVGTACLSLGISLIYANLGGAQFSYDKMNTSDLVIHVNSFVFNPERHDVLLNEWREKHPEVNNISKSEEFRIDSDCVMYSNFGKENQVANSLYVYFAQKVKYDHNVPFNLKDKQFIVPDGKVAVCQQMADSHQMKIGGFLDIKTQFGNTYRFEICEIFKDPSCISSLKILFSDKDYEFLNSEFPEKFFQYELETNSKGKGSGYNYISGIAQELMDIFSDFWFSIVPGKTIILSNEGIISLIVSIASLLVGVFIAIMNLVTIRFSLKSALKREEREIGMLKAMGVNSLSYRILFCAKYIAFAVAGGFFGMIISMSLTPFAIRLFCKNMLEPSKIMELIFAAVSALIFILVVVLFTLRVLKRMQKISVVDALHGENRGERFNSLKGLVLFRRKKMNVPFFLALHDILIKVKRYGSLIAAYSLGFFLILLGLRLRDTICDVNYIHKYFYTSAMDFNYQMGDRYLENLYMKTGSYKKITEELNRIFKENDIPAVIENFGMQWSSKILINKNELSVQMMIPENVNLEKLIYRKGGHAPQLENEVAISAIFAKQNNLKLGDKLTLKYWVITPNGLSQRLVTKDFIITAFIDTSLDVIPRILMGKDFTNGIVENFYTGARTLNCKKSEIPYYIEKMQSLFSKEDITFYSKDVYFREKVFAGFYSTFTLIRWVIISLVSIVILLLTYLYQMTFIEDETSDIALIKSMGFGKKTAYLWNYFRVLILVIVSVVLGGTVIDFAAGKLISFLIENLAQISNMVMVKHFFSNYVASPLFLLFLVSFAVYVSTRTIKNIEIWSIRNE